MSATASWRALGTTATVVVTEPDALDAAREAVVVELAAIDLACSRFRDDSELAAVNAGAGRLVRVSPLFAQALAVALRAARMTGGAVDPTLGAELRCAGYDRDFAELTDAPVDDLPSENVHHLDDARRRLRGGWRMVELDTTARLVRIPAGVELDLGATAKALAADRAARAAQRRAVGRGGVLVSLGGDVSVAGPAPDGGWPVRVQEDHAGSAEAPGQTVAVASGGLATSGTTVRRWRAQGERRHHILDPRSGRPAAVVWRTATVAAATCVDANAASTAAIVRGADAPTWLLRCGLPARLVAFDGRIIHIGAWPRDLPAGTPPAAEVAG